MDGRSGTLRVLGGVEGCEGRSIGKAFRRAMLIAQGETDPSVEDQTQDWTSSPSRRVEKGHSLCTLLQSLAQIKRSDASLLSFLVQNQPAGHFRLS